MDKSILHAIQLCSCYNENGCDDDVSYVEADARKEYPLISSWFHQCCKLQLGISCGLHKSKGKLQAYNIGICEHAKQFWKINKLEVWQTLVSV